MTNPMIPLVVIEYMTPEVGMSVILHKTLLIVYDSFNKKSRMITLDRIICPFVQKREKKISIFNASLI